MNCIVHGVTKSRTRLSDFHKHFFKIYHMLKTDTLCIFKFVLRHFSRVQPFATLWTVVHHVPLSMRFSRQEYWSGLPFPSPGDLPDLGIELISPAVAGGYFTAEPPEKIFSIFK